MNKRHPTERRNWTPIRVELLAEPVPLGKHGRARLVGVMSDAPELVKRLAREWADNHNPKGGTRHE